MCCLGSPCPLNNRVHQMVHSDVSDGLELRWVGNNSDAWGWIVYLIHRYVSLHRRHSGNQQMIISDTEKLQSKVLEFKDMQKWADVHIDGILGEYLDMVGESGLNLYVDKWEFSDTSDLVVIEWIGYGARGYTDGGSISMPIEYLWDSDWQDKARAAMEEKKRVEREEKAADEARRIQMDLEHDRDTLAELLRREKLGDLCWKGR